MVPVFLISIAACFLIAFIVASIVDLDNPLAIAIGTTIFYTLLAGFIIAVFFSSSLAG